MTCPPCTHNCREGRDCPAQNKILEEDDDIQDYKRTWVGLTGEERAECWSASTVEFAINIEAKLKEKNT